MSASPPDRRHDPDTEEMDLWMARQSFWYRLRYLRRHPEARPLGIGLFFLMIKLVPLLLVGCFGYYMLLHRYLSGGAFAAHVGQEAGKALGSANMVATMAKWRAGNVTINELKGEGLPDKWFRDVTLTGVRFDLPVSRLFERAWAPQSVMVQKLELDVRAGLLGTDEQARLAKEQKVRADDRRRALEEKKQDPGPYHGRWGINPDGPGFTVGHVLAREAVVRWGGGEDSAGSVAGAMLEANRGEDGWQLRMTDGTLSFGWLRNARLGEFVGQVRQGVLTIERASFTIPAPAGTQLVEGVGTMAGRVVFGDQPQVEILCQVDHLDVTHLLPDDCAGLFAGQVKGELRITGSTNREGGMLTQGAFEFYKGFTFGTKAAGIIPLLEVLGGEVADIPLRYLEAQTGGVRFAFGAGQLKVDGMSWAADNGERIEGQFTYGLAAKAIEGVFRVGIREASLRNHPLLLERYFREQGGGLCWLTIPLEGPAKGATGVMAEGMRAVIRQELDTGKGP